MEKEKLIKMGLINVIDDWLIEHGDKEIQKLVARNVAISNRILKILEEKNLSMVQFAELLDKSPSEITKLLSGRHNFNTETIVEMEVALEEDIISIINDIQPTKKEFEPVKIINNDDTQKNNEWVEFFDFRKKYQHNNGTIKIDRNLIEIHTGGWSENEELLFEFKKSLFYLLYFSHMCTGGHYYLDTDKNNNDTKHWKIIKE